MRSARSDLLDRAEPDCVCRQVREALCELEIPYRRLACGKGSKRRPELQKLAGSTRVPFLEDPNTGTTMGESEQIVKYLFDTYSSAGAAAGGAA